MMNNHIIMFSYVITMSKEDQGIVFDDVQVL